MAKGFLPYDQDQRFLLPPDLREWLPEGHLALFVSDLVDTLDLSGILDVYEAKDIRGRAGYDPRMMVKVLVYAYCVGKPSSRKIERATYEDIAFRVLSGNQHPDHDSIAAFRKQHLSAIGGLFVQVLRLCQQAGLVKLGHIAIDGTKIAANASKHKAMSYGRMNEVEKKLEAEVRELLAQAERTDSEEDARLGKGVRGDELPAELARRESRLHKIREAKASLEAEAKAKAEAQAAETKAKLEDRARRKQEGKILGRPPKERDPSDNEPDPTAQRNFTDPESRIMPDGANKGAFIQAYNAQIAVDSEAQIIVAAEISQRAQDKLELVPMAQKIVENVGRLADTTLADAGYFSEQAVESPSLIGTNLLVPPDRQKHHGDALPQPLPESASITQRMRAKLRTDVGSALYKLRKIVVEPVFGQIKDARGLRRFSFRGLDLVGHEWRLIAWTHNLLKLFRFNRVVAST